MALSSKNVKIVGGLAVAVLLLVAVPRLLAGAGDTADTPTAEVARTYKLDTLDLATAQPLPREVLVTGRYEPRQSITLTAKVGGNVTTMLRNVGDRVEAGDVLAMIDSDRTNTAEISLQENSDRLQQTREKRALTAQTLDLSIQKARDAVTNAERDLANAEANARRASGTGGNAGTASLAVQQAELALSNAETALANGDRDTALRIENARNTLRTNMTKYIDDARSALQDVDSVLGVSEERRYENDSYESYLGALDKSALDSAKQKYVTQNLYWKNARAPEPSDTIAIDALVANMQSMADLLDTQRRLLDATITSSSFTPDQLNALKATNRAAIANWNANTIAITSLRQAVTDAQSSRTTQMDGLRQAVANAEKALATAQLTGEGATDSASKAVADARSALDRARQDLSSAEQNKTITLADIDISIRSLQGAVSSNATAVGDYAVRAPIAGVVLERMTDLGESVTPGAPIYRIAGGSDALIKFDLSKQDRDAVNIGAEIQFTTGAGRERATAVITAVSPALINQKYQLEATSRSTDIALGDFVDVYIKKPFAQAGAGTWWVPLGSVVRDFADAYVWVLAPAGAGDATPVAAPAAAEEKPAEPTAAEPATEPTAEAPMPAKQGYKLVKRTVQLRTTYEDLALVGMELAPGELLVVTKPRSLREGDAVEASAANPVSEF